jgi:hypothetical protein
MDDADYLKEFCEDFGAPGPDDAALERILADSRTAGDPELRRLVMEVRHWRYLAPLLLDRIVPKGAPIDESDPILKMARFQIRGEGAIGRSGARR